MSPTPSPVPSDFLPSIRKRLAGFGFGSSQFDSARLDSSKGDVGGHKEFYRQRLPVSGEILPEVERSLADACHRLGLPRSAVHAFVIPSADMQAGCYSSIRGAAVIEINAGVIECLTPEELAYIFGHELGHYILPIRWNRVRSEGRLQPASLEDAMISRDNELTMDRFGLLACGDFKHAGSAILKMQSGLSSRHIRSDLTAFIQNSRMAIEVEAGWSEVICSHPPEFVRLRALNAFVMSDAFRKAAGKDGGQPIVDINDSITRDLDRAINAFATKFMDEAIERLAQTVAAFLAANRIKVESSKMNREGVQLDLDRVRPLAANWSQMPEEQRLQAFEKRLSEAIRDCVRTCPRRTIAYLTGLIDGLPGTPAADVCTKVKGAFGEALRTHHSD
jgi:hypothetical protein